MPVEHVINKEIGEMLSEYGGLGGVLQFKLFKISGVKTGKEAHLLTAQHTLSAVARDIDEDFVSIARSLNTSREQYFTMTVDQILPDTGIQMSIDRFYGPYFDCKTQRPILLGQIAEPFQGVGVYNKYYYYNDIETAENLVTIECDTHSDFMIQGFADAFLQPPHTFGGEKTNLEIGEFFLSFNRIVLGDFGKLSIYSWPTNCSNYFDAGKEWWGSYLWTVYNSEKDWFIGIVASTTD